MMPNIVKGGRMGGLLVYLCGPGRSNEHVDPHLVAGDDFLMVWYDDAVLHRDSALAIAAYLDHPRRAFKTEVTAPARDEHGTVVGRKDAHVWHCSLALEPGEGPLDDALWQAIAADFMDTMGFTREGSGRSPARWASVHHGLTKAGGDHIHIAASLVREDGTKVSVHMDRPRAQAACNELEKKYGLRVLASRDAGTGMPGLKPAEVQRAARLGRPEAERLTIARTVRACAAAAGDEAEFVRSCRREGLLVRARFAEGRGDVVVGYAVALRPVRGERPLYYGGNGLAKDLALPRLREQWPTSPQLAAEAAAEWAAAKRGQRSPHRRRQERRQGPREVSPGEWSRHAAAVAELREQLRAVPVDDRHTWAVVARQTAGAFAAWSRRAEDVPGPLAATADALARSAQMRYRQPRPKYTPAPALSGTAMLLMHTTGGRGPAADLVLMRQLANTMKAIHDAHVARGELKQALVLEGAVRRELGQLMQTLPQPAGTTADRVAVGRSTGEAKGRVAGVEEAEQPNAAMVAIAAAVGPDVVQSWRTDPAWPALEMRVVDLADDGLDPVATVQLAYGQRDFDDAASAVQVMTWRIDNLVGDNRAPTASPREQHPEVADALAALQAMTASTPEQAVRSPLPNQLAERRPDQASTPATPTATPTQIGD